jgi:hypothetical protein
MKCLPSSFFFFFWLWDNLIGPSLPKKAMEAPQNRRLKIEGSILKYRVSPFMPTYMGERRTTFAKAYSIKVRCYWEFFGEHVKKLENSLLWPHPTPPTHLEKREAPSLHDMTSHWLHGYCIPKIGCHYFWAGFIALLHKNTLPNCLSLEKANFEFFFEK